MVGMGGAGLILMVGDDDAGGGGGSGCYGHPTIPYYLQVVATSDYYLTNTEMIAGNTSMPNQVVVL